MDRYLAIVAGAIALGAFAYYLWDIIQGNTRPHRVTWGVWSLISILGVGSALQGGAGWGAAVALVYLVLQLVVFLLSLSKRYGKPGGKRYDYALAATALVVIIAWQTLGLPVVMAAAFAVLADSIGAWPTLRDAWRMPEYEPTLVWVADFVAASLALGALGSYSFTAAAYPGYLAAANGLIAGALVLRWWQGRLAPAAQHTEGVGV